MENQWITIWCEWRKCQEKDGKVWLAIMTEILGCTKMTLDSKNTFILTLRVFILYRCARDYTMTHNSTWQTTSFMCLNARSIGLFSQQIIKELNTTTIMSTLNLPAGMSTHNHFNTFIFSHQTSTGLWSQVEFIFHNCRSKGMKYIQNIFWGQRFFSFLDIGNMKSSSISKLNGQISAVIAF